MAYSHYPAQNLVFDSESHASVTVLSEAPPRSAVTALAEKAALQSLPLRFWVFHFASGAYNHVTSLIYLPRILW
jgi:hypothetical protein